MSATRQTPDEKIATLAEVKALREKYINALAEVDAARARIPTLEAQLLEASELLEPTIGYGVGILCVAEAVRVVLTELDGANKAIAERDALRAQLATAESERDNAEAKLDFWHGQVTAACEIVGISPDRHEEFATAIKAYERTTTEARLAAEARAERYERELAGRPMPRCANTDCHTTTDGGDYWLCRSCAERLAERLRAALEAVNAILADCHDEDAGCSFSLDIDAEDSDVSCLACIAQINISIALAAPDCQRQLALEGEKR